MGYSTQFEGSFNVTPRLLDSHALYLIEFARVRHVKRDVTKLGAIADPGRAAVSLPIGTEGEYCLRARHFYEEETILDYNRPPATQPSLWCQWVPTIDGGGLKWDGNEKFYRYVEWLQYLIDHFLVPWQYQLNGTVTWQGESTGDRGSIVVVDTRIIEPQDAPERLVQTTSPIPVPLDVWQGLQAIQTEDPSCLVSWVSAIDRAEHLGHPATHHWIEANLGSGKYAAGLDRGFQAIETGDAFVPNCCPIGVWIN
jgi:hypothetical protein